MNNYITTDIPAFVEKKDKKTQMRKITKITPTEEIRLHKEKFYQELLQMCQKLHVEKKFISNYFTYVKKRLKEDVQASND